MRDACTGGAALPGAGREALASVGADLVRRWGESHRRYHDLAHLAEVLTAVDALSRAGRLAPLDRAAALLAAWFHDAVYAVSDPDGNERRSAALAARSLGPLGAAEEVVDRVVTLVLDTAGHDLDEDEINDYITEHFKGDCLLAVGDDELIKIHFHTNEPWQVLEYCASLGEIHDIVVENMQLQSEGQHG